jgi:tRNA dimethylallyltransferase
VDRLVTTQRIAVVGPTAAGKSDLAVELARRLGAEVVNADSMQLYRGMDIGTAKLTEPQRRGVPHHGLDIWDVTRTATVAEYQQLATAAVADIVERGRVALLVGGSGLYVNAVVDGWEFPGTDPEIRARLELELALLGPQALHDRLAALDPAAGIAILPTNGRRIVRALEVVELKGSFTATLPRPRSQPTGEADGSGWRLIGLDVPREVLDARIEARVDRMWEAGLVDEVRALDAQGLREGRTASRALGYAQVLRVLAGELTEAEARDQTIAATRKFARRQDQWFRRDPRIEWRPFDQADLADALGLG